MFDPNTYKDEWTQSNNSTGVPAAQPPASNTNTTQPATGANDQQQSTADSSFHHFDGTKADVSGDLSQKYQNSLNSKTTEPVGSEKLNEIAEDIIDSVPDDQDEKTVNNVIDETPSQVAAADNSSLLEELTRKSDTAKKKVDDKIADLKSKISKLNEEVDDLSKKKEEIDKLATDLKEKLKLFDEEVEEIVL